MRIQPIPQITQADLNRVVERDYPLDQVPMAWLALEGCDTLATSEVRRIKMAALRLADGDLAKLERMVKTAAQDHRDVLAWAESPNSMRRVPGPGPPPDAEAIFDADWKQYQDWVRR